MELDNIKVVKKTKTVKKLVKKQDDEPELEDDKVINTLPKKAKKKIVDDSEQQEVIDNEEQPVKKVIKKVVKKAKQEDPDEINNDNYCFDKKIITASLKKKNNTFYADYVKDKPFNPEWVELVLGILSEHTIEDFTILNHLFENAKEGQYRFGWTDEQVEQSMKECYSPPYVWKREIGIEILGQYDGISYYQCPDCKTTFNRFTGEEATN
jgi:hypothetical protein